MTSIESAQAFGFVTLSPKSDRIDATAHLPGHGALRLTFGQSQNDVSAADILGGKSPATQLGLQFRFVSGTHIQCHCHGQTIAKQYIRSQCYSALETEKRQSIR